MNQYSLSCSNDKINSSSIITKITPNNIQQDFGSIYHLYKKEFSYHCEKLLLKSRNEILDTFFEKMKSIINYCYQYENKKDLENIIKKCENDFITNEYIPMYNALSLTLSIISTNLSSKNKIKYSVLNENLSYINNFNPHCLHHKLNNEYALHSCGEKFIQINRKIIKSSLNSKEKDRKNIMYVLCPKCKKSYKSNLIIIYCNYCEKNYFSNLIENKKNSEQLYPATWEKYHCINFENYYDINNYKYEEQMPCVKCGSKFWIKKNKLFCKKCKFEIEPINLVWTCVKCNKEFRSNAKIFNILNRKIIKHIIRDSLIQQKIAKPADLPCDCFNKYKFENITFYHKKEGKCNGILYYNSFNEKDYIICSLCQYISSLNDFNWFCPFCLRYFISNKIKIYIKNNNNSKIYIRKNILENSLQTKRYFSPKNIINISFKNDKEIDKNNLDRNPLRACFSQGNLGENLIYPKNRQNSIDKNINNSKYNSPLHFPSFL